jgi:plastocyanin
MLKRLALLGSLAIVFAGCGGAAATPTAEESEAPAASEAPAVGARTVDLEIGAGQITPATVDVTKGETITFVAKNVSSEEVELIVGTQTDVDSDSGDSLKEAEHIAAGASGSVTYTFDGAGPYAYGDQEGDHYSKGAKGVVVLKP